MKSIFLSLGIIFFLCSCSSDDMSQEDPSLLGTWKLTERYGSDGGEGHWFPVDEGYTYTFKSDSATLESDRFPCNGTYQIVSDSVSITFDCEGMQFNSTYGVSFEKKKLILTGDPTYCDEGCAEKFKRR